MPKVNSLVLWMLKLDRLPTLLGPLSSNQMMVIGMIVHNGRSAGGQVGYVIRTRTAQSKFTHNTSGQILYRSATTCLGVTEDTLTVPGHPETGAFLMAIYA